MFRCWSHFEIRSHKCFENMHLCWLFIIFLKKNQEVHSGHSVKIKQWDNLGVPFTYQAWSLQQGQNRKHQIAKLQICQFSPVWPLIETNLEGSIFGLFVACLATLATYLMLLWPLKMLMLFHLFLGRKMITNIKQMIYIIQIIQIIQMIRMTQMMQMIQIL